MSCDSVNAEFNRVGYALQKNALYRGYRSGERGGFLGHTETIRWTWRANADVHGDWIHTTLSP